MTRYYPMSYDVTLCEVMRGGVIIYCYLVDDRMCYVMRRDSSQLGYLLFYIDVLSIYYIIGGFPFHTALSIVPPGTCRGSALHCLRAFMQVCMHVQSAICFGLCVQMLEAQTMA